MCPSEAGIRPATEPSEAAPAAQEAQQAPSSQADLSAAQQSAEQSPPGAASQPPAAQTSNTAAGLQAAPAAAAQPQQTASTDLQPAEQENATAEPGLPVHVPAAAPQQAMPPDPGADVAVAANGMVAQVLEQQAVVQTDQQEAQRTPAAAQEPEQQQPTVRLEQSLPSHQPQPQPQQSDLDAAAQPLAQEPQRQLAKRPAEAPPSPPSPTHSQGQLGDASQQPFREDSASQEPPAGGAAEAAPVAAADGEPQQAAEQGGQQPVGEQQEQQKPQQAGGGGGGGGAQTRRNTPYICQVDGCGRNLAKEKEYYRRYRVCKSHAGAPEVQLGGEAKRYCQQCSVFHLLTDFDGDKRSCRSRLSWHNNKRRKKLADDAESTAAAAAPSASAPRVTRAKLAAKQPKPAKTEAAADAGRKNPTIGAWAPGRGAGRGRVSPPAGDGDAEGLQWAARGRRGSTAGLRNGHPPPPPPPPGLVPPWLLGLGTGDEAQRLAAAAGAAAAAAAAPQPLLAPQYGLQTSSGILAVAQGYGLGQGASDAASLARHLALAGGAFGSSAISQQAQLAALAGLQGGSDAAAAETALLQVQLQQLARAQATRAAAEAAAAREAAAAQAAAQAAALAQLRSMPQEQRMQDPRAATSLINVVRAAFEKQQQQQQQEHAADQQHQQQQHNAIADQAAIQKNTDARSSAFQLYRPMAVRAAPGASAAAKAAAYTVKSAIGAQGSPPKADGSADWKARLLQRFQHAEAADGDDSR